MGINKDLGLPFGDGMERVAICFDVDGTLIGEEYHATNTKILLDAFIQQNWKNVDIIVWSGGGKEYVDTLMRRWKLEGKVKTFGKLQHEEVRSKYAKIISIDDVQDTRLGDVNLIVRNK